MLDALNITEADAAGLSELAALDLAMAKDFAARAQAAEDPQVASGLARSYQAMARSYRQTLALKLRLQRELARAALEAAREPLPIDPRALRRRTEEVRDAVTRIACAEFEGPEREDELEFTLETLEELLLDGAATKDFARRPLDEAVADACRDLELSPKLAARWRDLPDPEAAPDVAPEPDASTDPAQPWRGSG